MNEPVEEKQNGANGCCDSNHQLAGPNRDFHGHVHVAIHGGHF
jgi:hypothetical protein